MGCHFLLQGIFPTQGSNPCLLHWQADSLTLSHQGSPVTNSMKTLKMIHIRTKERKEKQKSSYHTDDNNDFIGKRGVGLLASQSAACSSPSPCSLNDHWLISPGQNTPCGLWLGGQVPFWSVVGLAQPLPASPPLFLQPASSKLFLDSGSWPSALILPIAV